MNLILQHSCPTVITAPLYQQDSLIDNGSRPKKLRVITHKPISVRFVEYFNHAYSSIELKSEGWVTRREMLTPSAIWERWQDGDRLIGLRFGKETNYGMLDIDKGSPLHNEQGLSKVKGALEDIGITSTLLIRSSFSHGWHLYYFLPESVPTFDLAQAIAVALANNSLELCPGALESFPNVKSYQKQGFSLYNGHRLPLQNGSYLLDDDLAPYSSSIEHFLDRADSIADCLDLDLFNEAIANAPANYKALKKSRKVINFHSNKTHLSNKAQAWKQNLEILINEGWTGKSQTNDLLFAIAQYGRVFEKLAGQELVNFIVAKAESMPGYGQYCQHRHHIHQRAKDWAKSVEGYYLPYCARPARLGGFQPQPKGMTNEEKKHECMTRVAEAVEDLRISNRLPAKIGDRRKLIAMTARCSERTLAKADYLMLWHPKHENTESLASSGLQSFDHTPPMKCAQSGLFSHSKNLLHQVNTLPAARSPHCFLTQTVTGQGLQQFNPDPPRSDPYQLPRLTLLPGGNQPRPPD